MLLSLLLQLLLPVGLICWLAVAPAKSVLGYFAQTINTGLVLLALYLVALWMLLPWWLPLVYASFWIGAIAIRILRDRLNFKSLYPENAAGWSRLAAILILGTFAAYLSWQAIQGRQPPEAGTVDISLPLGPGTYLVANGGSREIINSHMMTLDSTVSSLRKYRGQSYGIDLIEIDRLGLHAGGIQPREPDAYEIYGKPVFAPCDGTIIASRNDRPDMPVPVMDLETIEGNFVLLSCADFVVLLAHFRRGSVIVQTGDQVIVGEQIGAVGNSGKTTEPHLHISAQFPGVSVEPLSGEPLALTIDGRFLVRNDRIRANPK